MRDPFPIPAPKALVSLVAPISQRLSLHTLPIHAHEVIFAFSLYLFIARIVSPILSRRFAGKYYNNLSRRTQINWDVHVVSFCQSIIICALSLSLIFGDEERKSFRDPERWPERIWAYGGITGLVQSFALGYFLWDFYMCSVYVHIFGWGMLAHAVSAVSVFSLGYRPFLYFYCPVFLLYELSSPFLNIHWFCDKVNLTGSVYQAINGALLTSTFFFCRIVWGLYSSFHAFRDMYWAYTRQNPLAYQQGAKNLGFAGDTSLLAADIDSQTAAFMGPEMYLPGWIIVVYFTSNLVLNLLNLFWFSKMVQTIRKRFDPPFGTKGIGPDVVHYQPVEKEADVHVDGNVVSVNLDPKKPKGSVKNARQKAEEANGGPVQLDSAAEVQRGIYADGRKTVEVSGATTGASPGKTGGRSRRKA